MNRAQMPKCLPSVPGPSSRQRRILLSCLPLPAESFAGGQAVQRGDRGSVTKPKRIAGVIRTGSPRGNRQNNLCMHTRVQRS